MKQLSLRTGVLLTGCFLVMLLAGSVSAQVDTVKAREMYNEGIKSSQEGDLDAAILSYQGAIKFDPNYADAHLNLGAIYFERKQYELALEQFEKAVEIDPNNADALANLGRVEYVLRRYDASAAALQKAIDLKPADFDLYKELGKTYYRQNDHAKVIEVLEAGHQKTGGGDWLTHYMVGKAYQKTSRDAQAIESMKKSIAAENNYNAQFALGQIYMSQEKYQSAAGAFKAALNADKSKYLASYNYASAMEFSNPEAYSDNIANWEAFVRLAKNNPKARTQVNQAQEHIKELREALRAVELQGNN